MCVCVCVYVCIYIYIHKLSRFIHGILYSNANEQTTLTCNKRERFQKHNDALKNADIIFYKNAYNHYKPYDSIYINFRNRKLVCDFEVRQ